MDCTVENCLINVVVVAVNYSSGSNHKRNAQFYELTLIIPSQNPIIAGFVIEALIKVVIVLQTGGILTCLNLPFSSHITTNHEIHFACLYRLLTMSLFTKEL